MCFVESAFCVSANFTISSRYALVSSLCRSRSFPCCTCILLRAISDVRQTPIPARIDLLPTAGQPLYIFHCTAGCCSYRNNRCLALDILMYPTRSQCHATINHANLLDNKLAIKYHCCHSQSGYTQVYHFWMRYQHSVSTGPPQLQSRRVYALPGSMGLPAQRSRMDPTAATICHSFLSLVIPQLPLQPHYE